MLLDMNVILFDVAVLCSVFYLFFTARSYYGTWHVL